MIFPIVEQPRWGIILSKNSPRLNLECRGGQALRIVEVGIGEAAPAVADKERILNLGR